MPARVPALQQFQFPNLMGIERNALAMQGQQAQNTLLETQAETAQFNLGEIQAMAPLVREQAFAKSVMSAFPRISWDMYPQFYAEHQQRAQDTGVQNWLVPPEQILQDALNEGMDPASYYEREKQDTLTSIEEKRKQYEAETGRMKAETGRIKTLTEKPGEEWEEPYLDKTTGALMQKNKTTGKISKIAAPPKGMVIESDGAGGFTFRTGVPTTGVTKKTQGMIEEKLLGGTEQFTRMQAIYDKFKPEYLEIGSRLKASWTSIKARLGKDVSKEDAKFLTEFKQFQRRAIENINLYIKELTGAQMSEKEASRLRLAQPDPGEKWWKGDDPITFKAKMDDVMKASRAAVARYEWYKAKGLGDAEIRALINSDTAVTLESLMEKI